MRDVELKERDLRAQCMPLRRQCNRGSTAVASASERTQSSSSDALRLGYRRRFPTAKRPSYQTHLPAPLRQKHSHSVLWVSVQGAGARVHG